MRMSRLFFYSDKNYPSDADLASDKLLRKANILVKTSTGEHYYTPLLLRSLKKLEKYICDKMSEAAAQEILLPSKKESSEVFPELGKKFLNSYKQLPLKLFQINTKFSDNIRSKFGIIRSGEYTGLDVFTFDIDETGMNCSYEQLKKILSEVMNSLNIGFISSVSGSGEDIIVLSENADDSYLMCPHCGYSSAQSAAFSEPAIKPVNESEKELIELYTPDIKSVKQLVEFTGIPEHQMIKTIIYKLKYKNGEKFTAVLMRGDLDISETKLINYFSCESIELASQEDIISMTGAEVGFAGPFGLNKKIEVIGDSSILGVNYFLCGLNKTDYHNINVYFGRDISLPEKIADLHLAQAGDICGLCKSGKLAESKGFKIGHLEKHGDALSRVAGITIDNKGKQEFVKTCSLNLNISALLALSVEFNSDGAGIIWPAFIAPYQAVIIPADKEAFCLAENTYTSLLIEGMEVLFDDRDASPGFKFKDADLIGIPYKIIFGKRAKEGIVEIKDRRTSEKQEIPVENIFEFMKKIKLY